MARTLLSRTRVDVHARSEGDGAGDGLVLPLDMVGDIWSNSYTLPILLGLSPDQDGSSAQQNLSVQVDMGSSDLWLASTSCSTSACSQAKPHLYDPTGAGQTGQDFNITYLEGSASGPIVWDTVTIGSGSGAYQIGSQALAAADEVQSEPLSSDFSGVMGLALSADSVIAQKPGLHPVTSGAPDGQVLASNLFGLPTGAPDAQFLSLAFARPGSDRIPSLIGIGKHPTAADLTFNTSLPLPDNFDENIAYGRVIPSMDGSFRFWKVAIRGITVYVDGQPRPLTLPRSASGFPFPSAVLDSGVPVILASSEIANGVYGAINIGPAKDGQYYVPCTTPLNMSLTVDVTPSHLAASNSTVIEIPIHPLDLTAVPPSSSSSSPTTCMGVIQADDEALTNPATSPGDIILGVPFLRNVYTVMAYQLPDANGQFPPTSSASSTSAQTSLPSPPIAATTTSFNAPSSASSASLTSGSISASASVSAAATVPDPVRFRRQSNNLVPAVGLLPLTDPATALEEFNTVRVLQEPLGTFNISGAHATTHSRSISHVAIDALIGLGSFFALCVLLFGVRWWFMRRSLQRQGVAFEGESGDPGTRRSSAKGRETFIMQRLLSESSALDGSTSEDELRRARYERYLVSRASEHSGMTADSDRTRVGPFGELDASKDWEDGYKKEAEDTWVDRDGRHANLELDRGRHPGVLVDPFEWQPTELAQPYPHISGNARSPPLVHAPSLDASRSRSRGTLRDPSAFLPEG